MQLRLPRAILWACHHDCLQRDHRPVAVVSPSCPMPVPSAAHISLPKFCSPGLLDLVQGIELHDALTEGGLLLGSWASALPEQSSCCGRLYLLHPPPYPQQAVAHTIRHG